MSDDEIAQVESAFVEDQVVLTKLTVDTHNRAQWLVDIKAKWQLQRKEQGQLDAEKEVWEQEEMDRREESRKMNLEVHGQSQSSGFY